MKQLSLTMLAIAGCLALAACVHRADGSADPLATAQNTIAAGCVAFPVIDAGFKVYAQIKKAPADQTSWETKLAVSVQGWCAQKPDITTAAGIAKSIGDAVNAVRDFLIANPTPLAPPT